MIQTYQIHAVKKEDKIVVIMKTYKGHDI